MLGEQRCQVPTRPTARSVTYSQTKAKHTNTWVTDVSKTSLRTPRISHDAHSDPS